MSCHERGQQTGKAERMMNAITCQCPSHLWNDVQQTGHDQNASCTKDYSATCRDFVSKSLKPTARTCSFWTTACSHLSSGLHSLRRYLILLSICRGKQAGGKHNQSHLDFQPAQTSSMTPSTCNKGQCGDQRTEMDCSGHVFEPIQPAHKQQALCCGDSRFPRFSLPQGLHPTL